MVQVIPGTDVPIIADVGPGCNRADEARRERVALVIGERRDPGGVENLHPGDIVALNYPYWNAAHAYDATLFMPVFEPSADRSADGGGILVGFLCVRAHWMDLGAKDPGVIVIDEVAGMFVSVLFLPRTLPVLATAFVLFRLFDIWKPFPARESQVFTGGIGVMLDDLIAGAYALVLIAGARALFGVPR